ncbi:MAG: TIGR03118 family protein [Bryobacteraceae bacterium]
MRNVLKIGIVLMACAGLRAQDTVTASYTQTNLVSDVSGIALHTDPNLKNPWGLSRGASTYWWASDEATGLSTLYDGSGNIGPLVVKVPPPSGTGKGTPTGTVALGSKFIFVTLDGTISQWSSGNAAVLKVNHSASGASYTGCTLATRNSAQTLYVANAASGVEAYTTAFAPVTLPSGAFVDPNVPAGYTPYGIQSVGTKIYVTFAQFTAGAGKGFVDVFDVNGTLLLSLQHGTWMNQPWGIAHAPATFGKFSNTILVGNVGSGQIHAFNASTGKHLGALADAAGHAIANPGLWAIGFGTGGLSGPATTLYFAAGINSYLHGLFGTITAN